MTRANRLIRTALLLTFAVSFYAVAAPVPKGLKKKSDAELLEGRWVSVSIDEGDGHKPDTGFWIEVDGGLLSIGTTKA